MSFIIWRLAASRIRSSGRLRINPTAKTAENATDYSLQNTVRQILFLPTTREQKYKANVKDEKLTDGAIQTACQQACPT
mgnify:CR=1 FL=1